MIYNITQENSYQIQHTVYDTLLFCLLQCKPFNSSAGYITATYVQQNNMVIDDYTIYNYILEGSVSYQHGNGNNYPLLQQF